MDALERVKHVLAQLPREDQAALAEFLRGLVVTPEEAEEMLDPARERVVATVTHRSRKREDGTVAAEPTITYRLERVKCGKKGCAKCPHGPYVYKYWRENGRLRKAYGGRPARLPDPERDPAQATFAPHTGEFKATRRRGAWRPAAGAPPTPASLPASPAPASSAALSSASSSSSPSSSPSSGSSAPASPSPPLGSRPPAGSASRGRSRASQARPPASRARPERASAPRERASASSPRASPPPERAAPPPPRDAEADAVPPDVNASR